MASLITDLVSGIVETALKEILKKTGATPKRKKRQARSATTGKFVRKVKTATAKPARKQVSRRRTAAGRSKQRNA